MRAAVITKLNAPWELKNIDDPRPGAGQVVIRIRASGMCGTDVHVHHGHLPVNLPIVAGHEPVGEVVELGAGVTTLKVGDRVGVSWNQKGCGRCAQCQGGKSGYCAEGQSWMNLGGGNSELMLAWETGCSLLPDKISWEDAAPIFCAGFTVMSGLRNANPKPGDRVAVVGIGGLGHLAVQFAAALGLETLAVTGSADKTKFAKQLGASDAIVGGENVGKTLADAGGADIVLCTTNSAAQVGQVLSGLRPEGRLVNMGLVDGPIVITDQFSLMLKQCTIKGSTQNNRSDLMEALQLVASGKVKPILEVYPLSKANEVFQRVDSGKVRFRAVLQHGG